jgi:hypothetical protein
MDWSQRLVAITSRITGHRPTNFEARKDLWNHQKTLAATSVHPIVRRLSLCSDAAYSRILDTVWSIGYPSREARLIADWILVAVVGGF